MKLTYSPDKVCGPAEHLNLFARQGKKVEEAASAIKVSEILSYYEWLFKCLLNLIDILSTERTCR